MQRIPLAPHVSPAAHGLAHNIAPPAINAAAVPSTIGHGLKGRNALLKPVKSETIASRHAP